MCRCENCGYPKVRPGEKVFVVERRFPDGSLDVKGEPPPFLFATQDGLLRYYFSQVPGDASVLQETIREWYASKGWSWREKTW